MTVKEWLTSAKARLAASGVEAPNLEAQLLAGHVLLVDRPWLMAHPEETFPDLAGESILVRRLENEPLAYILGWREFYGRRFSVDPRVLIPRQDTEVLVETALRLLTKVQSECPTVLDLGTGSGCIAVSLKLEAPRLNVVASDISVKALEVASQNASDLGAQIRFIESDGFLGLPNDRFDAIVTNPPYIGLGEPLSNEVKQFEPHSALFGGSKGLEFYERLASEASDHLSPEGFILMEVGFSQAPSVADLFQRAGWKHLETVPDLSGIDRVVVCGKLIKSRLTKLAQ